MGGAVFGLGEIGVSTNTVVFDVIGTLFSLETVRRRMTDMGAPALALDVWFSDSLRDYFAASYAGAYTPFAQVLGASMVRLSDALGLGLTDDQRTSLMGSLGSLQLQPGATEAFQAFADAGWKQITLTNGGESFTRGLLEGAGVDSHFSAILSCDEISRSKPHPDVYDLARRHAEGEVWMVAAHAWDLQGASRAGFKTAYVTTKETTYLNVYPAPDVIEDDLSAVAASILEAAG
jgi:2-haloacid dehalogenase